MMIHRSVLLPEVLHWLDLSHRQVVIDATLGLGGHSEAILSDERFSGRVIGIDQDAKHLQFAQQRLRRFSDRFRPVQMNFGDLSSYLDRESLQVDSFLFDLGVASPHLDIAARGFSHQAEGPLDMRMNQAQNLTAAQVVNEWSEEDLTRIFFEYAEEPLARRIAKSIVEQRIVHPFETTVQLKELVLRVYQMSGRFTSKKSPATKVFQALRMAVNDELRVLESALRAALDHVSPRGRILVISYHSLEDRIVKDFFRSAENPCTCPPKLPECACGRKPTLRILTKKPITPSDEEIRNNPRARSAKLRVAEKI